MKDVESKGVSYIVKGKYAIITLNNPSRLNALTRRQYYRLASIMDEIDENPQVVVTVLIGKGRYFSAGANIADRATQREPDIRLHWLQNFVANNLYLTHAFSIHSKIFVAALNGPAIGGSAAVAAFADFIYAAPHTFLLTPFASLGLVAEVGTSRTLVQRLGISLANEAMLMGRKISSQELVRCGFANKIIDVAEGDDVMFLDLVMKELDKKLGSHLNAESLLQIKDLIRRPERDTLAMQNVAEVFAGWKRLTSGLVDEEMRKMRTGKKRHKL
ncbi:dodecenoyl-CoA isomerase [Cladophialophora chaetospira]|uniref:Dodecenoyl-CoA isomerase n=1 Tax=Cladophialophora chaetospira TaxID=386627 RepID=A0AA38X8L0_9EURO|nr:dodecenoyl-CoA isomerase [Cladophialophora chaetospira]